MAKPPYLEEDCMKKNKIKNHSTNNKAKINLSFFASIFSLFIYMCIFYIFNLSPYTLLNNNIFWFFMSNTLILIIAADYEAFSSSKQKQDLHQEYANHSQTITNHASISSTYDEQVDKQCITPKRDEKDTISYQIVKHSNAHNFLYTRSFSTPFVAIPERVLEIEVENQPKKSTIDCANEKKPKTLDLQVGDDDKEKATLFPTRSMYRRSKSYRHNRDKHVVIDETKKSVRRLESMKIEPKVLEEENEFSKMTNEDLNKRVEEFIQKFNKQIRLQASTINQY
ncbi:uncharacterized protein [Cicer arietinum]|uniref:Uncharacterized protein LOC101511365 n=1 Tax=Cicer arietinum TaxID=3827 RepID=A0A1S2XCW3_CICAR|nr:uncharacterized protein LOC101511365 [Cicer arietinum]